jgi:hypothetical protein
MMHVVSTFILAVASNFHLRPEANYEALPHPYGSEINFEFQNITKRRGVLSGLHSRRVEDAEAMMLP